jgi:probable phosphoglycerate mutase
MRIILTRHGETEENIQKIHQGWLPGTLSKHGKEQAKRLALELKNARIDVIYTSDLKRCSDTAEEILRFHSDVIFIKEPKLRERNHGEFQGTKVGREEWDALHGDMFTNRPKGGESFEEMWARVELFYKDLLKKYDDEVILIVGHGGSVCLLQGLILGKSLRESIDSAKLGNASYSIFDVDKKGNYKVICINSRSHLE